MTDQPHVVTTPDLEQNISELEGLDTGDHIPLPDIDGVGHSSQNESIPTDQMLVPIVGLLCSSIAPAWDISVDEQNQLVTAYAMLINKYFPDGLPMGPEVAAIMITASIVLPRLGQPLKENPASGDQSEHSA